MYTDASVPKCAIAFTTSTALSLYTAKQRIRADKRLVNASLLGSFKDISFNPQSPAASGSFGDVFFGTEQSSQRQVVLKRCRRSQNARHLFRKERLVNRTLDGDQYWPLYLGEHVHDSEQYLVWKREQNACTLHTYLFERRIMDLYGVLGVGLDSSAAGVEKRLFESVVKHLLLAVGELHASGFVHRDVKPSNILVVSGETRGSCRFKLIDFGSCKDVRPFSSWFNGQLDTLDPLYGAPETRFSLGNDAYKFDVFSVGMIGLAAAYGSLRSEDSLRRFRRRMEAAQWNLLRVERESAVDGSGWRLGDNERVTRVLRGMLCGRAGGRLHVHDALHELHAAYVQ